MRCGKAFGSAPRPEINLLNTERYPILLNAPCTGKPNVSYGCENRLILRTSSPCTDAKTSARVAKELQLLPFYYSFLTNNFADDNHSTGVGVVGAVGFEPTTSTV